MFPIGSITIPKLIVRNDKGADLFVWGPRPKECQQIYYDFKKTDLPILEKHKRIQTWYSKDKCASVQKELLELFS